VVNLWLPAHELRSKKSSSSSRSWQVLHLYWSFGRSFVHPQFWQGRDQVGIAARDWYFAPGKNCKSLRMSMRLRVSTQQPILSANSWWL